MKVICHPEFAKLLTTFSPEVLNDYEGAVYGLSSDLCLQYFNPAWVKFAKENNGDSVLWAEEYIGTNILDVIPDKLKQYYQELYEESFMRDTKRFRPQQHRYQCSSAALLREFAMSLYPLQEGKGLLVVNTLVVEKEHPKVDEAIISPDEKEYRNREGFIQQCCHCRTVQHQQMVGKWDWVPQWVEDQPENIRHTICDVCTTQYYPAEN